MPDPDTAAGAVRT